MVRRDGLDGRGALRGEVPTDATIRMSRHMILSCSSLQTQESTVTHISRGSTPPACYCKDLMATENNPTPMGLQPGDLGPAVACNTSCVSLSTVNSFATDCFALTETVLVGFLSLASSGFFACTYQLFRGSMTVGIGLSEPGHSPSTHTDYILKVLERNNKCQPQRSRSRVFSRVIVELGFRCLSSTNSMPW